MTYENYLIHSSERRNLRYRSNFRPKYIAKEGKRYFYSQADYDAFKRGRYRTSYRSFRNQPARRQENKRESSKTKIASTIDRLKSSFNKTISEIKKFAADVIEKGKNFIIQAINKYRDKKDPDWRRKRRVKEIESEYVTNLKKSGRDSYTIRKMDGRYDRDYADREIAIATSGRRETEKKIDRLEEEYRRLNGDNIDLLSPVSMRIVAKNDLKKHVAQLKKYQAAYDAEMAASRLISGTTRKTAKAEELQNYIISAKSLIKGDQDYIESLDKDISRKIERGEY